MTTLQIGMGWFAEQPGGLDRYYGELLHHLPATGTRIHGRVVGSTAVGKQTDDVVRSFASPTDSILRRWRGVARSVSSLVRTEDIDLIASHFALYALPVWRRLRAFPHVVHFHGPWAEECYKENPKGRGVAAKRTIEGVVYRTGDRCIVLSSAFGHVLSSVYGVDEELIRVIPGGVDAHSYATGLTRDEARARLDWPTDRPIVFCVRRLRRRMGLEALIDSIDRVRRSHPDVLVLIGGKGPLQNELHDHINKNGLEKYVRLLGFVPDDDMPVAYRAADVTIVPTEALEGFGLVTIESLAAGTPVLVTPVGGLPEAVSGLSRDLVMNATGMDSIANALIDVLDGRIRLPTPEACQTYVRDYFDWSVIAERVCAVYQEAIQS